MFKSPAVTRSNCLLAVGWRARRAVHPALPHGLDQHGDLPNQIKSSAHDTDQVSAALVKTSSSAGCSDDTAIHLGRASSGRTVYSQGQSRHDTTAYHPVNAGCYTIWLAAVASSLA